VIRKRSIRCTTLAVLALSATACNEPSSPSEDGETVAEYVASISVDGTEGELRTLAIPRPRTDGPAIELDGHVTIVNGGTATLTVTSATPFRKLIVAATSPVSRLFVPVSGYFEITLPAATQEADLLLAFPQQLPSNDFDLYFAAEDASGNVGTLATQTFDAIVVGTGDLQVTVTWNTDADVDLHVVDPAGSEIYWANRQSPSGGELDLDSNAACVGDNVRNENITWALGTAPQGEYVVRVDYWSSCSASKTDYTVLMNNGGDVQIFRGTFYGSGDSGGSGSGVEIGTFTRTTGPIAAPLAPGSRNLPVGPTTKGV
jgi:hypothetical protein